MKFNNMVKLTFFCASNGILQNYFLNFICLDLLRGPYVIHKNKTINANVKWLNQKLVSISYLYFKDIIDCKIKSSIGKLDDLYTFYYLIQYFITFY